jgi:predicted XRE-type DNA-binding protein
MPMLLASALPITGTACFTAGMGTKDMLEKERLGEALRAAMALKKVTQQRVADEFGVRQSSVAEWVKFGRIRKKHIPHLVEFFSDVVGPEHWGLPASWSAQAHDPESPKAPSAEHWKTVATMLAKETEARGMSVYQTFVEVVGVVAKATSQDTRPDELAHYVARHADLLL